MESKRTWCLSSTCINYSSFPKIDWMWMKSRLTSCRAQVATVVQLVFQGSNWTWYGLHPQGLQIKLTLTLIWYDLTNANIFGWGKTEGSVKNNTRDPANCVWHCYGIEIKKLQWVEGKNSATVIYWYPLGWT